MDLGVTSTIGLPYNYNQPISICSWINPTSLTNADIYTITASITRFQILIQMISRKLYFSVCKSGSACYSANSDANISTSRSSSSSFISSKSSFSNSSSTIKSSTKPPIYKPSLLYKPTKYNKIAPRSKYGLKNVIRFNSFGGKTKTQKVRFL